ncbi:MAG: ECF transporter S component [Clostridia bacterium]|nr:ECF transporter S component [Clostridia bacterium]
MSKNGKTGFTAKRIAIDALFIALEFALSMLSSHLEFGGVKITLVSLPIILCALLYGPIDAAIIAFLGELLMQMLSWGFTQTTLLWCLPETVRAVILGTGLLWARKTLLVDQPIRSHVLYYAICVFAAAVTSVCNTTVYYIDAKMFGYYNYALIFGVFWLRLVVGTVIGALLGALALPLARRLRAAKVS